MRLLAVLMALGLACGCAPRTHRAQLNQLHYRAVFDLACHAQAMQLYHVDARTKVVVGCGRRLIYQEDCATMGAHSVCSWRLDTPIAEQWAWPRPLPTLPARVADCEPDRGIHTELFDPGIRPPREIIREAPYDDPLEVPPPEPQPRGRRIFDELEQRR